MNYKETLSWLYTKLPMFQRIGDAALKKDLGNIRILCEAAGNPQEGFAAIHVAGTNGKGSVSSMLAAILTASGFKTGLYTSPHLKSFTERIRVNGKAVSEKYVVDFVKEYQALIEKVEPSFFEVTVMMAFDYFTKEKVDFAVVEVGMGGRLDSTNILDPVLSVITNISLDHQQHLGETIAEIAGEKAGIIKAKVPVVIGEKQIESESVFIEKANSGESKIVFAEDLDLNTNIKLDLHGDFQKENLRTVLAAVAELKARGVEIPDSAIQLALANVRKLAGLRGRMEMISKTPKVLVDIGHNIAGIEALLHELNQIDFDNLHIVWGMAADKDRSAILKLLPDTAHYYFCKPDVPRGHDAESLRLEAAEFSLKGNAFKSVSEALDAARAAGQSEDLIFVGGSAFVVAEVL